MYRNQMCFFLDTSQIKLRKTNFILSLIFCCTDTTAELLIVLNLKSRY